ncbi:NYN domain-containing protein [Sanguibacter suaedae]|uniref:NYN domain-containing protein n=1 Tax=Sanguibacter suaedae TaxID=2795737 RepID=A0A934I2P3_9MICO|nr:NYN domain-containing protein [Sanguibacter suaedae]MBI9114093.1 NYN domain-containing protein [Sanguibacter suaedae]
MPGPSDPRVAVYIDFDNIIISRYDQLHGRGSFHKHRVRKAEVTGPDADRETRQRLVDATVDLDAVLDFASSLGTVAISRAYADWSVPVNASYRGQLVDRAVDLTQMFPTVASMKNGADIRLAIDVVEDLFSVPDLTHVVIVAGDSDYIALAQRSKRLGRYVVGIGVAGATSASLASACDEFVDYDALPGVMTDDPITEEPTEAPRTSRRAVAPPRAPEPAPAPVTAGTTAGADQSSTADDSPTTAQGATAADTDDATAPDEPTVVAPKKGPSGLLVRALRLGHAKDDAEWLHSAAVKNHMLRMDPTFNEKALGYRTFTEFVKSRGSFVEVDETGPIRKIRLRSAFHPE